MRKLDDLIVFIRVVERESFVGAARQLHMPAATVSRKVQELEARLGIELLRRTTRRVSPTEAGLEVYERAARGLALIEEAELVAKQRHDRPEGLLRLMAPFSVGMALLEPVLMEFQALYPDVQISLVLNNDHLDLVEHDIDVALRVGELKDSTYAARLLFHGQPLLVAAPSYIAKAPPIKRVEDLEQHPFLSPRMDAAAGNGFAFIRGKERKLINLRPYIVSNEASVIVAQAVRGAGLCAMVDGLLLPFLRAGTLQVVLPEWRLASEIDISIVFRRHTSMDPKVRAFVDFMAGKAPGLRV